MDELYGSQAEAEAQGEYYPEVDCGWVKTIKQVVAVYMVIQNGLLGTMVMEELGWKNWGGIYQHNEAKVREWLEEQDQIGQIRCPRLFRLWKRLVDGEVTWHE